MMRLMFLIHESYRNYTIKQRNANQTMQLHYFCSRFSHDVGFITYLVQKKYKGETVRTNLF